MKLKELKYENKELKSQLKGKNNIVPLQRKQDKENEDYQIEEDTTARLEKYKSQNRNLKHSIMSGVKDAEITELEARL